MNRRSFVRSCLATGAAAGLLPNLSLAAPLARRRVRPSDPDWPSQAAWQQLHQAVQGRFMSLQSPFEACRAHPESATCNEFFRNIKNPYYVQENPALTQTLGWVDGWASSPSAYVVAAENASDIAAAVNFARQRNVRLVIKGGGHSYMGNSNAPDSLLIWTHRMQGITRHDHFVPRGAPAAHSPQRAVTLGAGVIWEQAYDAVTTKAGGYVQGGGCTTVGVAGLIQGGGFGSYSKFFGLASSGLLEAEVITADGQVRTVNAFQHPDLFWALKGGGGGTFGVISNVTVRVQPLPAFCGRVNITVKANSDQAFTRLLGKFFAFYKGSLFNPHWGETVSINPDNTLGITMHHVGLSHAQAQQTWRPFLEWLAQNRATCTLLGTPLIDAIPMRHAWDGAWDKQTQRNVFSTDPRPGKAPNNIWWAGDTGQVSFVIWAYDSLWLPTSLLSQGRRATLVNTLFKASRQSGVMLHFNKGLGGASPEVLEEARNTPMNPAVCDAFALVIAGAFEGPAYPGIRGHEPDLAAARKQAAAVQHTMDILRTAAPAGGSYISEASFFDPHYRTAAWGKNYDRLARIKRAYDPDCLFSVHHGVGAEQ